MHNIFKKTILFYNTVIVKRVILWYDDNKYYVTSESVAKTARQTRIYCYNYYYYIIKIYRRIRDDVNRPEWWRHDAIFTDRYYNVIKYYVPGDSKLFMFSNFFKIYYKYRNMYTNVFDSSKLFVYFMVFNNILNGVLEADFWKSKEWVAQNTPQNVDPLLWMLFCFGKWSLKCILPFQKLIKT